MTKAVQKIKVKPMLWYKVSWRGPDVWHEKSVNRGKPRYHEKQFRGTDLKSAEAFARTVKERIANGECISDLELRGCTEIWGRELSFPMAVMSDKLPF